MRTFASGHQGEVRRRRRAGPQAQRHPEGRRCARPAVAAGYLERESKGRGIIAKILEDGFEFDGQIYRSLS